MRSALSHTSEIGLSPFRHCWQCWIDLVSVLNTEVFLNAFDCIDTEKYWMLKGSYEEGGLAASSNS